MDVQHVTTNKTSHNNNTGEGKIAWKKLFKTQIITKKLFKEKHLSMVI